MHVTQILGSETLLMHCKPKCQGETMHQRHCHFDIFKTLITNRLDCVSEGKKKEWDNTEIVFVCQGPSSVEKQFHTN